MGYINDTQLTSLVTKITGKLNELNLAAAAAFRGGLAIADTPTGNGFWLPTESGTYTNAGGIVVDLTAGLTVLAYDGTTWKKVVVPLPVLTFSPLEAQTHGITNALIDLLDTNDTLVQPFQQQNGYISPTTGAFIANASWRAYSYNLLQGVPYLGTGHTAATSTCLIAYFNKSGAFISSQFTGTGSAINYNKEVLTIPDTAVTAKITGRTGQNFPALHFEGENRYYFKSEIQEREHVVENKAEVIYDEDSALEKVKQFPTEVYNELIPNPTTGILTATSSWLSKKYYVEQGRSYFATGRTTATTTCLAAYYDVDGLFVSSELIGDGTVDEYTQQALTLPANAVSVIITGRITFVPYLYKESKGFVFPRIAEALQNRFYGKKLIVTGDSITAYAGNMFEKASARIGMSLTNNYGIAGSSIAELASNPTNRDPIVTRYSAMTNDADIIIVNGGTNDCNYSYTPFGVFTDRTPNTFLGAMHLIAQGLKEKYVGKTIIFMTPIKRNALLPSMEATNTLGKTQEDYAEAIIDVGKYWGIPVLDMFRLCAINPFVTGYETAYLPDGTHPNDAGYELMTDNVVGFLNSI